MESDEFDDYEDQETENCPECGRELYDDADICPHCGHAVIRSTSVWADRPAWFAVGGKALIWILIALFLLPAVMGLLVLLAELFV